MFVRWSLSSVSLSRRQNFDIVKLWLNAELDCKELMLLCFLNAGLDVLFLIPYKGNSTDRPIVRI